MGGLIDGVRIDLERLHATWMELFFPRQRSTHSVLGKWTPNSTQGWIAYRGWGALGMAVVTLLYPFVLIGFATRFYSRRINRLAVSLGILGVVGVTAVVWGALTAVAYVELPWTSFLAVAAAAGVATICSGLAVAFTRFGGRVTTVVFAYPSAMTALFLPPVVAALFSPTVSDVVLPPSTDLAIWLLNNLLFVGDLNEWIRANFELEGWGYVGMWAAIAVPLGWLFGFLVTLADVVRPKSD